jgi:hypothetical integral membrane protein (TIGR02206 family)
MFLFDEGYLGFEWMGTAHLVSLCLVVILFILMFIFKSRISNKVDLIIRRTTAVLMVLMEWTFYAWSLRDGVFQTSLLPFGVCAVSMYVTSYALWTKNEKVFQFIFPWAIAGALISLTVADLSYTFPHFRFFHYFGNHSLFLLGNIYMLVVQKFKFNYKDLLKSSLYLFIYAAIMYPINFLLDSNHLFLREVPHEVEPMYAFLGSFWVFGFVFSIALLFQIIYIPIWLSNIMKAQKKPV